MASFEEKVVELNYSCVHYQHKGNYVGILVHGAGTTLWNDKTNIYEWLISTKLCNKIYSIELPNHGKNIDQTINLNNLSDDEIFEQIDVSKHIESLKLTFSRINIKNKSIIMILFSLGGVVVNKILPHITPNLNKSNQSIIINIGCIPNTHKVHQINLKSVGSRIWGNYWSPKYLESISTKRANYFKKVHRKNYKLMMLSVKKWFIEPNSATIIDDEYINEYFKNMENKHYKIYYIFGEYENVYPYSYIKHLNQFEINKYVYILPCDHFTYFTDHWMVTKKALNTIIYFHQHHLTLKFPLRGNILSKMISKF